MVWISCVVILWGFLFSDYTGSHLCTHECFLTDAEITNNIVSVILHRIQTYLEKYIFLYFKEDNVNVRMFFNRKLLQMFDISQRSKLAASLQRRHASFSRSVITEEWNHLCNHLLTVLCDKHPACKGSKDTNPSFVSLQHFVSSFGKVHAMKSL